MSTFVWITTARAIGSAEIISSLSLSRRCRLPPEILVVHGVVPRHTDDFRCELHANDPEAVEAGVEVARQNLRITDPDNFVSGY